jgi:hypothetical protein
VNGSSSTGSHQLGYRGPTSRKITDLGGRWQERRDSNPQPPVLETGALPIELHSY